MITYVDKSNIIQQCKNDSIKSKEYSKSVVECQGISDDELNDFKKKFNSITSSGVPITSFDSEMIKLNNEVKFSEILKDILKTLNNISEKLDRVIENK